MTHAPETDIQHYPTGPTMEFKGQEEERKAKDSWRCDLRVDIEEVGER